MKHYKIIIAQHAGFCMGVHKAYHQAIKLASEINNIVLYGNIVHNDFAINEIANSGLKVNEKLNEILVDKSLEHVIIRAHGVTPSEEERLKSSKKITHDLTCPIVKKVQLRTKDFAEKGYSIILLGKKNHPEVIGIAGYADNKAHIISSVEEAKELKLNLDKPVLITQTTINKALFEKVATTLSLQYPNLIICNTLCNNTIKTQEAALELAKQVDFMLVVGDRSSSNTLTLFERVSELVPSLFVENINEVVIPTNFPIETIGITGGSSTPDSQIKIIVDYLSSLNRPIS